MRVMVTKRGEARSEAKRERRANTAKKGSELLGEFDIINKAHPRFREV